MFSFQDGMMLGWGPASFVVLFVLSLHRLIIRASSRSSCSVGLLIKGRPAEEPESGKLAANLVVLPLWLSGSFQ